MIHWHTSSALGLILTGRYRPVCSIVHGLPACRPRTAFARHMDAVFREDRHCGRIHDTWLIGRLLRGPIQYDPPPVTGRTGPDAGY